MDDKQLWLVIHSLRDKLVLNERLRNEFVRTQYEKALKLAEDNQQQEEAEYYSISEISKKIGKKKNTIYSWLYRGRLNAKRLDGHWRITEKSLQKFLNNKG